MSVKANNGNGRRKGKHKHYTLGRTGFDPNIAKLMKNEK